MGAVFRRLPIMRRDSRADSDLDWGPPNVLEDGWVGGLPKQYLWP